MSPITKLTSLGQSLWYDNIQRKILENGEFKAMIERGDIRGVTSNPSIFNNAIAKSTDYDSALTPLAWAGWDTKKIFWQLVIEDIKAACDAFLPLYEESNGGDGYVSIEVTPDLAYDTEKTIAQAQQLWARVARKNLMVKIPATKEGIPAIRKSIAAGININITLIFSLKRYAEVMDAYLSGLEDRVNAKQSIDHIASVASFFVSRVDTKVDPQLPEGSPLKGKAAIANAKLAYDEYHKTFAGSRWEKLKYKGARVQRPLWASTSTKNPAYPDTYYVDNLIGPETVNTIPPATLDAFKDHGTAALTLMRGVDEAQNDIAQLEARGISMGRHAGGHTPAGRRRHLRRQDRQGRGRSGLDPPGHRDRAGRARLQSLPRRAGQLRRHAGQAVARPRHRRHRHAGRSPAGRRGRRDRRLRRGRPVHHRTAEARRPPPARRRFPARHADCGR